LFVWWYVNNIIEQRQASQANHNYWHQLFHNLHSLRKKNVQLEMWANAQRDGRPAKYRWRTLFNAAKFG